MMMMMTIGMTMTIDNYNDDDDDDDDHMDGQGAKRENSRNPLIIGNANLPLGSCIFDNHEL